MTHWGHAAGVGTIALVLALTGCGQDDGSTAAQSPTTTTAQPGGTTPATTTTGAPATTPASGAGLPVAAAQQALQTAAQAVPNSRAFDLETGNQNGKKVFLVKVASDGNQINVQVDETGKQLVSQNQQATPDDDVAKIGTVQIDASRALQTAAEREPNATFDEMEIDTQGGVAVWKIELVRPDGSEVQVHVDAQNGSIR